MYGILFLMWMTCLQSCRMLTDLAPTDDLQSAYYQVCIFSGELPEPAFSISLLASFDFHESSCSSEGDR